MEGDYLGDKDGESTYQSIHSSEVLKEDFGRVINMGI